MIRVKFNLPGKTCHPNNFTFSAYRGDNPHSHLAAIWNWIAFERVHGFAPSCINPIAFVSEPALLRPCTCPDYELFFYSKRYVNKGKTLRRATEPEKNSVLAIRYPTQMSPAPLRKMHRGPGRSNLDCSRT